MKTFGLIGGTSWHSTVEYYATINRLINERHGDNTNPLLRIISLNQKRIHELQRSDDWDAIAEIFETAARELQADGADGIALCANTPHKVFDRLHASVAVPILHIADAIGAALVKDGVDTVGLIGTRFTMAEDFIKGRLKRQFQVKTIVPTDSEQHDIQELIYHKLSVGVFDDASRAFILQVIERLAQRGARAVILGCTEFPLLLSGVPCAIPLIDSLKCHCDAIVDCILDGGNPAEPK